MTSDLVRVSRPADHPPLLPSEVARASWTKTIGPALQTDRWPFAAVLLLAALIALHYLAPLLIAAVAAVGGRQGWLRYRRGGPAGWLSARKTVVTTGLGVMLASALCWLATITLHRLWAALVALAFLEVLLVRKAPPAPEPQRDLLSHDRLVRAMLAAGILDRPSKDQPAPMLGYEPIPGTKGLIGRDDRGAWCKVRLPEGKTWKHVRDKALPLAGALDLPERLLVVDHDPADAARVVNLWAGRAIDRQPVPSPMLQIDRTRWQEPYRIGLTPRGDVVSKRTRGRNGLTGGMPDQGKTVHLRSVLLHFLADPTTSLYGCDGKGSRADYSAVTPHAVRWVWGTDDDAGDQLADLLEEVLQIVKERNVASDREPAGGWPGVLVLLEELQEIRSGADAKAGPRIDDALERIAKLCRSVNVVLEIATQKPDALSLPTGVRSVLAELLALRTRDPQDSKLILGVTPRGVALPSARGEALLLTDKELQPVDLDHFPADEWKAALARVTQGRPKPARPRVDLDAAPVLHLVKAGPVTLESEVLRLLADAHVHGLDGVPASVLLERLPEQVRPASRESLGIALARMSVDQPVRRRPGGRTVAWQFDPAHDPARHLPQPCADPAQNSLAPCAPTGSTLRSAGFEALAHAQNGTPDHVTSLRKASP